MLLTRQASRYGKPADAASQQRAADALAIGTVSRHMQKGSEGSYGWSTLGMQLDRMKMTRPSC